MGLAYPLRCSGFVSRSKFDRARWLTTLQWIWPIPLLIVTLLAPESPWWLIRHGHIERAKQSLRRLTSKSSVEGFDIDNTIQMMIHTDQLEREVSLSSPRSRATFEAN